MRINSLDNNNKKAITFGYDKTLNNRVQKKLTEEPTDLNTRLLVLNDFCNKTEDMIVLKEKRGVSNIETEPLIDVLIGAKMALSRALTKIFPALNYSDIESEHYLNASDAKQSAWREDMSFALSFDPFAEPVAGEKSEAPPIEEFKPNAESPKGFSSLGGMAKLKAELYDKIIFPIQNPEQAKLDEIEYGKKFPRGVLLYGPPGCGKTFVAEAVAMEAGVPMFKLKIANAGSMYINETSKNYEMAFAVVAEKSKEIGKPCILFMDELDGLSKKRGSQDSSEDLKQLGTLLDLINTARSRGIIVLGATNRHDVLDDAISSRFDGQVFVGLPDKETRTAVLKKCLEPRTKGVSLMNSEEDLSAIVDKFEGFSNRSITDLTNAAGILAKNDGRRDISKEDYLKVIAENQNLKIKSEDTYQSKSNRKGVGFSTHTLTN